MTNDIALRLKVLRRKGGLTQNDCAHLLGTDRLHVSAIEVGAVTPEVSELALLAIVYGKPMDALASGAIEEARRRLAKRLGTLPPAPRVWLNRFNRHHTLNALAVRLEALSACDGGAV